MTTKQSLPSQHVQVGFLFSTGLEKLYNNFLGLTYSHYFIFITVIICYVCKNRKCPSPTRAKSKSKFSALRYCGGLKYWVVNIWGVSFEVFHNATAILISKGS